MAAVASSLESFVPALHMPPHVKTVAIFGARGSGKTTLALEIVRAARKGAHIAIAHVSVQAEVAAVPDRLAPVPVEVFSGADLNEDKLILESIKHQVERRVKCRGRDVCDICRGRDVCVIDGGDSEGSCPAKMLVLLDEVRSPLTPVLRDLVGYWRRNRSLTVMVLQILEGSVPTSWFRDRYCASAFPPVEIVAFTRHMSLRWREKHWSAFFKAAIPSFDAFERLFEEATRDFGALVLVRGDEDSCCNRMYIYRAVQA